MITRSQVARVLPVERGIDEQARGCRDAHVLVRAQGFGSKESSWIGSDNAEAVLQPRRAHRRQLVEEEVSRRRRGVGVAAKEGRAA